MPIARVAGLLAVAALGAVIAGQFAATIDDRLAGQPLSPAAQARERDRRTARSRSSTPRPAARGGARVHAGHRGRRGLGLPPRRRHRRGARRARGPARPRRHPHPRRVVPCAGRPGGPLAGAPLEAASPQPDPARVRPNTTPTPRRTPRQRRALPSWLMAAVDPALRAGPARGRRPRNAAPVVGRGATLGSRPRAGRPYRPSAPRRWASRPACPPRSAWRPPSARRSSRAPRSTASRRGWSARWRTACPA